MPVLASNSFNTSPNRANKRQSGIFYKPASSASNPSDSPRLASSSDLVNETSFKRDSMQSTDSSATSSSKDGGRSAENVEFEGDDAHNQAQSSASSGCGHDDAPVNKLAARKLSSDKGTEVFSTPRSSAEHENGIKTADADSTKEILKDDSLVATPQAEKPSSVKEENTEVLAPASEKHNSTGDADLVAAPAIPTAVLATAVVPPTPTQPEWESP